MFSCSLCYLTELFVQILLRLPTGPCYVFTSQGKESRKYVVVTLEIYLQGRSPLWTWRLGVIQRNTTLWSWALFLEKEQTLGGAFILALWFPLSLCTIGETAGRRDSYKSSIRWGTQVRPEEVSKCKWELSLLFHHVINSLVL